MKKSFFSNLKWIRNRYLLTGLFAAIWMMFFDKYDLISQIKMRSENRKLQEDIEYYKKEINKVNEERQVFHEDYVEVEKYAREHYLMKRPEEDLFVIIRDSI